MKEFMKVRKNTISLQIAYPSFSEVFISTIEELKATFSVLFDLAERQSQSYFSQGKTGISTVNNAKKPKFKKPSFPKFNSKKFTRIVLPLLLIGFLISVGVMASKSLPTTANPIGGNDLSLKPAIKMQGLNRGFKFPIKDQEGEEIGSFNYTLEKAEIRNEIIVQGKRATAVEGRAFLIINLKIVNELNQGLNINSRDYVRLSVNGNDKEWLAPDIHNDPVEVQAISTKYTRIGFPINETDKNLVLRVGEINGKKEIINLPF